MAHQRSRSAEASRSSAPAPGAGAGASEEQRAQQLARRYLRGRVRCAAELRAYLIRHHVPPPVLQSLIDTYVSHGILDDRAYAKLRGQALADRGYAWAAVCRRLLATGVPGPAIEAALHAPMARERDLDRARTWAARRSAGPRITTRQRAGMARWLARRGYDPEIIVQVLGSPETHDDEPRAS